MDLELKGKKVIVSAATRGLGRRMVERFLDEGAIVSFCGRRARGEQPRYGHPQTRRPTRSARPGAPLGW